MICVIEDRSSSNLEIGRPKSGFERSELKGSILSELENDSKLRASRACTRRVAAD